MIFRIWYNNLDRSFFRFVTNHAFVRQTDRQTDRRTDRQTEFSSLDCTTGMRDWNRRRGGHYGQSRS